MKETCETCRFFKESKFGSHKAKQKGDCLRFPPTWGIEEGVIYTHFPLTVSNQWCGEYQPKQEPGAT